MKKTHTLLKLHGSVLNSLLLLVVAVLLALAIFLVRIKLLQNAQDLGMELAHSYAVEEERNLSSLETNFTLAGQFVDEIICGGGNSAAVQDWLTSYFSKLTRIVGEDMVDFYAVIDGKLVAVHPWEGDDAYRYEEADWYRMAIEAEGKTVRGKAYLDAVTGQRIFTISRSLSREGSVLAMDVYIQNEALHNSSNTLPENCSYFLCDENGNLLYAGSRWSADPSTQQHYMDYILTGIRDGKLAEYDSFVTDPEGVSRGVYFQTMDNGWTVILTIPTLNILMGDENTVIYILAAVALVLFLLIAYFTILDALRSRSMKQADDTAHMLGHSFYSIYRVNVSEGSYEGIKIHKDLQKKIPPKGSYASLLKTMCSLVKPKIHSTFGESFSLESIRKRMDQGVKDYGGDFQRQFESGYRWVNIRTLYNRDVDPDVVILCFRDVDEEKKQELQNTILLQDALETARKSTRDKNEFFSRMSHDMRTPLNAIIGCCGLAEKSCADGDYDKFQEYIRKIRFSGRQLLELINDILEISRMEAGKSRLNQGEVDLQTLISDIAGIFQDRAQEGGKTLEARMDIRDSLVMGDEKKITQIINNLLSNAVKYTNPGDSIRLDVRQFEFGKYSKYQIIVEDTGIGMSPGFLEHLFDPYTRETTFASQTTIGTGLGMSIVKSLVRQMSGEISVDSRLGEGTRVAVTIPMEIVSRQNAEAEREDLESSARERTCFSGRTILVAEDNEINREIVTEVLKQMGARVLAAVHGREAVELFSDSDLYAIDAVLMDMQMPVMDGCEAARTIRGLDRADAAGVPIIAVTANVFAEDIDRTTQAGMNDHISKPIDSIVLWRTLQKLMLEWDHVRGK